MGFDDVIPVLGDFGKYQKRIYFLLCLPAITSAFHKLGNVFLLAEPQYRCRRPDEPPDAPYNLTNSEWEKWYPVDSWQNAFSCEIRSANVTTQCSEFIYNHEDYGYTTTIEWNLTCQKAYLIATANSMFMVGVMMGSIIFGETSDRLGRKITFLISSVMQVVFGVLAALAPEFWTFAVARMLTGAAASGVFLIAYVMGLEMVGPSKRLLAGMVVFIFFSGGYVLTALLAKLLPNWRHLQLALSLPGVIFIFYWWFIPESVRWLLSKNKITEAKAVIQKCAKVNGVTIEDAKLDELLQKGEKEKKKEDSKMTASVIDLFKHSNLRKRSLIIFFDWCANNITYYGLSWNTNNLGGNPYLNFVISGAVETPANIFTLLTLNRWGRKKILCGSMMVAGAALLATTVAPANANWLTVLLAMIGKISITVSYGTVYIFSAEQFPTVVRNAGLGASSTFARLGSIVAPYINMMARIWQPFPLLVFGSLALSGGVLSLLLPETLNKKLPETLEEGENFGKKPKRQVPLLNGVQVIEAPKETDKPPNEAENPDSTLLRKRDISSEEF
ncbi:organic cation transporter protein-like [Euwallacea similis]|uniref:organic cation transporter protein-like n=1 Tax=Euwallacea similis TaxID=1736056 RepID=UPI00344F1B78